MNKDTSCLAYRKDEKKSIPQCHFLPSSQMLCIALEVETTNGTILANQHPSALIF